MNDLNVSYLSTLAFARTGWDTNSTQHLSPLDTSFDNVSWFDQTELNWAFRDENQKSVWVELKDCKYDTQV